MYCRGFKKVPESCHRSFLRLLSVCFIVVVMCFVVVCVYIKPAGCPGCLYETKIERGRA